MIEDIRKRPDDEVSFILAFDDVCVYHSFLNIHLKADVVSSHSVYRTQPGHTLYRTRTTSTSSGIS